VVATRASREPNARRRGDVLDDNEQERLGSTDHADFSQRRLGALLSAGNQRIARL